MNIVTFGNFQGCVCEWLSGRKQAPQTNSPPKRPPPSFVLSLSLRGSPLSSITFFTIHTPEKVKMFANFINLSLLAVLPITALASHGPLLNRHHELAKRVEGNVDLFKRVSGSRWSFYNVETGNALVPSYSYCHGH